MKKLIIILVTLFINCALFGQISQGGQPYSFDKELKKITGEPIILSQKVPTINMPKIKEGIIEGIKAKNAEGDGLYQFAYDFTVDINVKKNAVIDDIGIGLLYRIAISSQKANSINLIFKKYSLPRGAKLYIYSENKESVIGSFTSNNNKSSGRLPTLPIEGDKIIVEYFEPYYADFEGALIIGKVNHDFLGTGIIGVLKNKNDKNFGDSGPCQVDVNCSEGANWQTQKRAVCKIIINGNGSCSGTLINNTSLDGTPYFLTANHCIDNNSDANNSLFIFNYESPSCGGGDGSTSQSVSGGSLRSTNASSDFTLIELSQKPLATWNPHYAGWDRNNTQNAGGVGIHHPRGDVKKIATHNISPISTSDFNGNYPNNFWLINNWSQTTNGHSVTERGSSGSALFNNNHQVIGQLLGGATYDCSNPSLETSYYGKIFSSWNTGGTMNSRLKEWLDPINSGVMTLNGADACPPGVTSTPQHLNITHTINAGVVEIHQATQTITATNIIKAGATARYEAGQLISLKPGFHAESGSDFNAVIKNNFFTCVPGCYPITVSIVNVLFSNGGNLCLNQTNAKSYHLKLLTVAGNFVYQTSGTVNAYQLCIPMPNGLGIGVYQVQLTLYNGDCEELSFNYYAQILGSSSKMAQDISEFDFEIYPNPNNGNFKISIETENMSSYSFKLINALGRIIYEINNLKERTIKIDKTGFPSGIYYIKVNDNNSVVTKKIIIN